MSYYVIEANNAGDFVYELIFCEHCKYFRKAEDHDYRYRDTCGNPFGLVRPRPEGFCNYAIEKPRTEAEHE